MSGADGSGRAPASGSRIVRWVIASSAILAGIALVFVRDFTSPKQVLFVTCAEILLLAVVVLVLRQERLRWVGRVVAAIAFLAYTANLVARLLEPSRSDSSEPEPFATSTLNAFVLFFAIGLPALRYAVRGRMFGSPGRREDPHPPEPR